MSTDTRLTKTQGLLLASLMMCALLVLHMASRYFNETWIKSDSGKSDSEKSDSGKSGDLQEYGTKRPSIASIHYEERNLPVSSNPIVYSNPVSSHPVSSQVRAKECSIKKEAPFLYDQGVDGKQCVEKCPAPTLPDVKGHCKKK